MPHLLLEENEVTKSHYYTIKLLYSQARTTHYGLLKVNPSTWVTCRHYKYRHQNGFSNLSVSSLLLLTGGLPLPCRYMSGSFLWLSSCLSESLLDTPPILIIKLTRGLYTLKLCQFDCLFVIYSRFNNSVSILSIYYSADSAFLTISELLKCCYTDFASAVNAYFVYQPRPSYFKLINTHKAVVVMHQQPSSS